MPEGGLLVGAASHRNDLQAEGGSRPVENQFVIQGDTTYDRTAQKDKGQHSGKSRKNNVNRDKFKKEPRF